MKMIWIPKSETKATVRDGQVVTWDEMTFTQQPIKKPDTGFTPKENHG